jgi:hypothetical protein
LVTAFESYVAQDFTAMIVSASVAVEAPLGTFLDTALTPITSSERREEFLRDAATFSYQLNVLLPLVLHRTQLPRMPEHLRGPLNRLRKLRNQIAHCGCFEQPLEQAQAAELICAAFFGFKYLEVLKQVYVEQLNRA